MKTPEQQPPEAVALEFANVKTLTLAAIEFGSVRTVLGTVADYVEENLPGEHHRIDREFFIQRLEALYECAEQLGL